MSWKKVEKKLTPEEKPVKATKAEIQRRVLALYKMITQGAPRAEILLYASENWHITERQTDEYLSKARDMLRQQSVYNRDEELVLAVELLKHVGRKALSVMDYQRVIAAQREINLLLGLYAPASVKHTGTIAHEHSGTLTVEERRSRIAELLNTAGDRRTSDAVGNRTRTDD